MAKKLFHKQELGLGIRALLTNIDNEVQKDPVSVVKELSNSIAMIPLNQIEVNPFQPRHDFDLSALEELADSIRIHGLIQPITVRRLHSNAYQLISGERRLRASKLAGIEEVPAYIRMADDQALLEMALIENIQREDLNAIEIAISFQRLKEECSLTDEQLAERTGKTKSRSTITNYLRLLRLSPEIQQAIKDKKLTMGHAKALAGVEDFAWQSTLFRQTLSDDLSVRALEKLIQQFQHAEPKKIELPLPNDYDFIQKQFRAFFGNGKLQLKLREDGKGQIIIPFQNVNDLNNLLEKIED
jgi:ParB family chromosome partitioning protein